MQDLKVLELGKSGANQIVGHPTYFISQLHKKPSQYYSKKKGMPVRDGERVTETGEVV